MSLGSSSNLPPAPPGPADPLLSPPGGHAAREVEPWQARLEIVALLLLISVALTVVARLAVAYDQSSGARAFDDSVDLVGVVRSAGEQFGLLAAGGVLIALLLVTLGPEGRVRRQGVLALRATTVVGLAVAGLCAFAGVAALATDLDATPFDEPGTSAARTVVNRLGVGVPLLLAAAIAGYVAWCAFSALGESPQPVVPSRADDRGDLGAASEGRWEIPPSPPVA